MKNWENISIWQRVHVIRIQGAIIYTHTHILISKDLKLAVQAVKNRSIQIDQSKKELKFMSEKIDSN